MRKTIKSVPLTAIQITEFEAIQSEHGVYVYRIALGFSRNREDAEDIAQETFIKAYKGFAGFKGDSSIKTWLHRIIRNTYLDLRRSQKTNSIIDNLVKTEDKSALQIPDHRQNAAVKIFPRGYFFPDVENAVALLPASKRRVIILAADGYSIEEMGTMLNCNIHGVRSTLLRTRNELRKTLNPISNTGAANL